MDTRVELRVSGEITPLVKRKVKVLTEMNTSNRKEIKIWKDKVDDNLLIIRFKSHAGKSSELAGSIMKTYSLYLENYSDISVKFGTRRNNNLDEPMDEISKRDISRKVKEYFRLIDKKNWEKLNEKFLENIEYGELKNGIIRRTISGKKILSKKYLRKKEIELKDMVTKHEILQIDLLKRGRVIICDIEYSIQELKGKGGVLRKKQEIGIMLIEGELKISRMIDKPN